MSLQPQPALSDVVAHLERRYPPATAESWDAVGLVAGDPTQPVRRVLFAVDPVAAVADEAIAWGADLVVVHHPLLLRGVHSIAATEPKGALLHRLVRAGCALYAAHTNADSATRGVADALADVLGVTGTRPLVAPSVASEPGTHDVPLDAPATGLGRVGRLAGPTTLRAFAEHVAQVLPATPQGVRVAGDLDALVQTVAVLGGSGDSEIESARAAGADVYLTSDLKHHPVSDARELDTLRGDGRPFLIDTAHFASEWPWLRYAAEDLVADLSDGGAAIEVRVSTVRTDPWTARFASPGDA